MTIKDLTLHIEPDHEEGLTLLRRIIVDKPEALEFEFGRAIDQAIVATGETSLPSGWSVFEWSVTVDRDDLGREARAKAAAVELRQLKTALVSLADYLATAARLKVTDANSPSNTSETVVRLTAQGEAFAIAAKTLTGLVTRVEVMGADRPVNEVKAAGLDALGDAMKEVWKEENE